MQMNREAFYVVAFVVACVAPFLSLVVWSLLGFGDMRTFPDWLNTSTGVLALVGGFCMLRFRSVIRMLMNWREDQEKG